MSDAEEGAMAEGFARDDEPGFVVAASAPSQPMTTEQTLSAIKELCREFLETGSERLLSRNQPCGCVVCACDDDAQCHGCGATNCGAHLVGQIPNPVYDEPKATHEAAMARATIAAIDSMDDLPTAVSWERMADAIIAAFPDELLARRCAK